MKFFTHNLVSMKNERYVILQALARKREGERGLGRSRNKASERQRKALPRILEVTARAEIWVRRAFNFVSVVYSLHPRYTRRLSR